MPRRKRAPDPPRFIYNPHVYDEVILGMFGRKWDDPEPEELPPFARGIWSCLFRAAAIQSSPDIEDAETLLSIFENTQSPALQRKAECGLQTCLLDCSGVLDSLKTKIKALLDQSYATQNQPTENQYALSL